MIGKLQKRICGMFSRGWGGSEVSKGLTGKCSGVSGASGVSGVRAGGTVAVFAERGGAVAISAFRGLISCDHP